MRTLRIDLPTEILYLCIFITYMRGLPLVNTSLFTLKLEFLSQIFKNDPWITKQ